MSPEFQECSKLLRDYMFENVYIGSVAKKEESKAELMIEKLFLYLLDNPHMLPEDSQNAIETEGLERTVLDYVAGMSDRYAVKKFQEIYIPAPW